MYNLGEKIITFLPPESIEPEATQQIKNTASMPFVFHHVAVMPDTHYGKGSTVGTVLATKGAVIPAAVGVDIGCGMIAVETSLKKDDLKDLHKIRVGLYIINPTHINALHGLVRGNYGITLKLSIVPTPARH